MVKGWDTGTSWRQMVQVGEEWLRVWTMVQVGDKWCRLSWTNGADQGQMVQTRNKRCLAGTNGADQGQIVKVGYKWCMFETKRVGWRQSEQLGDK